MYRPRVAKHTKKTGEQKKEGGSPASVRKVFNNTSVATTGRAKHGGERERKKMRHRKMFISASGFIQSSPEAIAPWISVRSLLLSSGSKPYGWYGYQSESG